MVNTSGEPAIVVDGLRVRRGGRAVLHDLHCVMAAKHVTGLVGPSGSGKSTLMRSIVGVQIVEAGSVRVLGSPAGSPALRTRVGYVTQAPSVYADLTVRENLQYFASVLGTPASDADRVIRDVDLRSHADVLVGNLSGGQQNRASLAVALLGTPEALVLDEPTVGLDPVLRRDLWSLFRSLAERGVAVLVSSHVMDEAARCDRVILLRDGSILADDTPAELLRVTATDDLDAAFLELCDRAAPTEASRGSAA